MSPAGSIIRSVSAAASCEHAVGSVCEWHRSEDHSTNMRLSMFCMRLLYRSLVLLRYPGRRDAADHLADGNSTAAAAST